MTYIIFRSLPRTPFLDFSVGKSWMGRPLQVTFRSFKRCYNAATHKNWGTMSSIVTLKLRKTSMRWFLFTNWAVLKQMWSFVSFFCLPIYMLQKCKSSNIGGGDFSNPSLRHFFSCPESSFLLQRNESSAEKMSLLLRPHLPAKKNK